MIDLEKTIRKIMIDENVNLTELGRRINNSTSNLSNKLRRNNLYSDDLKKIKEYDELTSTIEILKEIAPNKKMKNILNSLLYKLFLKIEFIKKES